MGAVIALADQVAGSEASILITGESGTGKEVLARYVHRKSRAPTSRSSRSTAPPSRRTCSNPNCSAMRKGAFTGAIARRVGKFEEANGGTLLLDEISEMDARLQAKLLRAIQEREIDRVGGTKPVKVDIRIIATSNRDLADAAKRGTFREDLLYRLNVVNLRLPALRERPQGHPRAGAPLRAQICRGQRRAVPAHRARDRAPADFASLARQCARTREHDASRGAAVVRFGDHARGHPPAGRHAGGHLAPPDMPGTVKTAVETARPQRAASSAARSPMSSAISFSTRSTIASAIARMPPIFSASRSARCATSCANTRRPGCRSRSTAKAGSPARADSRKHEF
jgi:hypothetical protein